MAGFLTKFFGRSASEGAAFALGTAVGPTLGPAVRELVNDANIQYPTKGLDAGSAARLVAEQRPNNVNPDKDAARTGLNGDRFDALVELARAYPGLPELLDLWRRGVIDGGQVGDALNRHGFSDAWAADLKALKEERLQPAQIALGIVRSLLADPGFLPVNLDTKGGKVPAYGVSPIDPVTEAADFGIDRERLRVMVGEIGLPMALEAAAGAVFRGIIEREDFNRAVLEGDTRPEWADSIFEQARAIPNPADYVNAHIRGWISVEQMNAGTARHGMSAEDTHLLYLRTGRPAAPGQMATAAARGIDGPDGRPMDEAQFLKGIAESDIRPEWGPMLWGSRFLYLSAFQLARLVADGSIDADTAAEWARKERYAPEIVTALHASWSKQAPAKANPWETKAQTQLWGTLHRSFIAAETDDAEAHDHLAYLGVPEAVRADVLDSWTRERAMIRKQLTPAQVKKAYQKLVKNPDTGKAWTRDDAISALVARGYTVADAQTFLDS